MSRTPRSFVGVVVAALLFAVPVAAEARQVPTDEAQFSAGEELARTITVTTGVPISPLLGVSGLGAWRCWRASARRR